MSTMVTIPISMEMDLPVPRAPSPRQTSGFFSNAQNFLVIGSQFTEVTKVQALLNMLITIMIESSTQLLLPLGHG